MSNKFKIRNLENEKRKIDKLIAKLKREDEVRTVYELIGVITEERQSIIRTGDNENTMTQTFKYFFERKGNVIECTLTDGISTIVGKGISRCHSEDLFSESVGCTLAERRAVVDYYSKLERIETRGCY